MAQDEVLYVEPADRIYANLSWTWKEGWTVHVSSYTSYEPVGTPQEKLSTPRERYERLTLAEAIDVLEAEVLRRRLF